MGSSAWGGAAASSLQHCHIAVAGAVCVHPRAVVPAGVRAALANRPCAGILEVIDGPILSPIRGNFGPVLLACVGSARLAAAPCPVQRICYICMETRGQKLCLCVQLYV